MKLPDRKECIKLLKKYKADERLLRHCFMVNKASMYLGKKLKDRGEKIDLEFLDRGSLLHDIDKILTLREGVHGDLGKEILTMEGYPELGKFIRKHRLSLILKNELKTLEEKIVYYVDKRVEEDKIVSLRARIKDLKIRYSKHKKIIGKTEPLLIDLEKEIFEKISEDPKILNKLNK